MDLLFRMSTDGVEAEVARPEAGKVIAGDPVFTTWNIEERDGLYAGVWRCTPGKWRISYNEWEYCRILDGRSVIEGEDGTRLSVGPGDGFVLRPGFVGTWEVLEETVKEYVVRV